MSYDDADCHDDWQCRGNDDWETERQQRNGEENSGDRKFQRYRNAEFGPVGDVSVSATEFAVAEVDERSDVDAVRVAPRGTNRRELQGFLSNTHQDSRTFP